MRAFPRRCSACNCRMCAHTSHPPDLDAHKQNLPGNDFGGNSKTEYGPILANFYPAPNFKPQYIYENFHRTLPYNPCPASENEDDD
jgi:hypothetical protein